MSAIELVEEYHCIVRGEIEIVKQAEKPILFHEKHWEPRKIPMEIWLKEMVRVVILWKPVQIFEPPDVGLYGMKF